MKRRTLLSVIGAGMAISFAGSGWADVPAPPVNQDLGMVDVDIGNMVEADCRICHASGVPDRHHNLYGQPIPPGSVVPFPGAGPDYVCLSCHTPHGNFTVVRDCTQCHTTSPHHTTPSAQAGDCVACHGDLVDNMGDGHYIPTYAPSLVTPERGDGGDGLPLNSRGTGAGGCAYCHDDDGLQPQDTVILTNQDLHHAVRDAGNFPCSWCHVGGDSDGGTDGERMRHCEGCHGPDALHNIQADSPNPANPGTVVVGGEDAGYGHVGRDAGPGDSDCWGCHGFAFGRAVAPGSGPTIPTLYYSDVTAIDAGTDTAVTLTGSSFTSVGGKTHYTSDVALNAADGSSVILRADVVDQWSLEVTIPGNTPAGNYNLQAVKADVTSNPVVISIKPMVIITSATTGDGIVTIHGSGFGGYAPGSGTSVIGMVTTGAGKRTTTATAEAAIISWSDTRIEAGFGAHPRKVAVNSVFGSAESRVREAGNVIRPRR